MSIKESIATDFRLWGIYVDPSAVDTREWFDSATLEEKFQIMDDCGFTEQDQP